MPVAYFPERPRVSNYANEDGWFEPLTSEISSPEAWFEGTLIGFEHMDDMPTRMTPSRWSWIAT
nr:hypothetical protein [Thioalkalivibrio sp.]